MRRTAAETKKLKEQRSELVWKINHVQATAPSVRNERGQSVMAPAHAALLAQLETDLSFVTAELEPKKRGR